MSGEPGHTTDGWFRSKLGIVRGRRPDGEAGGRGEDERLARVWGIGACDVCGATIVLGEDTARRRKGERVVEVCPVCESDVIARGYRRAA